MVAEMRGDFSHCGHCVGARQESIGHSCVAIRVALAVCVERQGQHAAVGIGYFAQDVRGLRLPAKVKLVGLELIF